MAEMAEAQDNESGNEQSKAMVQPTTDELIASGEITPTTRKQADAIRSHRQER